ncbi:KUP/HAK/KT family potassium transporter [Leuconostoc gelidum subsp. gelidum]|uniref:Probable potassium transport system protein Kup n=1 Tax=Leuconostoc gelidum subsp. gelidum TaxID=1607839 RepID=A0AB35FW06_LEUGE|nr:KUP/HAK/KT family potassium transporter [Leuconostoc gelidum]MBZ5964004.1 KUP/HAK/KT family potassium transporter [Leuconostoc gelidum subsp. gelidum]MBZ5974255.1 KUP/HAK/KT family potassium transporter [Leuconostoc gelidum subsp. gelidum]MBZ5976036.1 KUP/HAK/KT family potassium transporter [Leuconostoc gelidum subsp. gelidum]MBZ5985885.1 KUP/HAK/KT family potassium transporter [Leuconostoc gelidum subsp. gelidum]MBZ5999959.1 KUP/HAK/KT family potassium transporter [Leuconostoc gelidum subs
MPIEKQKKWSSAGALITLGIVYGDIGTSPLYTMNSILNSARSTQHLNDFVIGSVSLVFWTLMLITTIKYVLVALRADNHGEGGIFALYSRVKSANKKWLLIPALIGGSALLADGTLTPAITVTTAIEGLKNQKIGPILFPNNQPLVIIVVSVLLLIIFTFQKVGTKKIGNIFGPIMLVWFVFIGFFGFINIFNDMSILKALSPTYAIAVLVSPENKTGIFILGSVFLATTGAEALYSDMGHVGKQNIYISWPFVYSMLILNYMGQGAWIMSHTQQTNLLKQVSNPFFEILPSSWRLFGVILATLAAIIASQALISGAYTLVSEAIHLKVIPRLHTFYPSEARGQMYIGTVNWILCIIGLLIVWSFQTSHNMEAAYGLSITITMLMTTVLLYQFIKQNQQKLLAIAFAVVFGAIEIIFLIASLGKFIHGGYATLIIMVVILSVMMIWYYGNKRREKISKQNDYLSLRDYRKQLINLSNDKEEPVFATNLVYIANIHQNYKLKRSIIYSLFGSKPKKAEIYWFVTVREAVNPYEKSYSIDMLGTKNIVHVIFNIGFKVEPQIHLYLKQISNNLVKQGIINPQFPRYTIEKHGNIGDFKYVMVNQNYEDLLNLPDVHPWDRFIIGGRLWLQTHTVKPSSFYGLDFSDVLEETVPLFISRGKGSRIKLTQIEIKNIVKPEEKS